QVAFLTHMATSSRSGTDDMDDFRDLVSRWRDQPFPPGSSDESIDELHSELALADSWVADSVIPYIERGVRIPGKVDVVGKLRELQTRAMELARGSDASSQPVLQDYLRRIEILTQIYQSFLQKSMP
ncbi:MAG: hypothetical protein JWM55_719, partial [Acidimicrobiaceae bacterium]|nr:hypothetical protein [Acidimicrobiaceae bacterium]